MLAGREDAAAAEEAERRELRAIALEASWRSVMGSRPGALPSPWQKRRGNEGGGGPRTRRAQSPASVFWFVWNLCQGPFSSKRPRI